MTSKRMPKRLTNATSPLLPFPTNWLIRGRLAWHNSLRFRLLALGLMPLLLAFPFVMGVLTWVGGGRADDLLLANVRAQLSSSVNYLDQLKAETGVRVSQLVKSERLQQLVLHGANQESLHALLKASAQNSGLDFLLIAKADGTVVGSSHETLPSAQLPNSFVIQQAVVGVANAAYERFDADQLAAFSPHLSEMAIVRADSLNNSSAIVETRGLLINAGAHFPLTVNQPDVILLGGILLNRNFVLIDHMREIVFPVGSLMKDIEGQTAIYIDGVNVNISKQRHTGHGGIGSLAPEGIRNLAITQQRPWVGHTQFGKESLVAGFEPLLNGKGQSVGMLGVAFPDGPYQRSFWSMLGMIAALLALTMLLLTLVFMRTARTLTQQLNTMTQTMGRVGQGERSARVPHTPYKDELSQLGEHFNALLDTISAQDERQTMAQKAIADEATRRRALFENERDGVVILNVDGSVFESNPKCAAMLGYSSSELLSMHVQDWDLSVSSDILRDMQSHLGSQGLLIETVQRRKNGHRYPAEVSLSHATWGDKSFIFLLQRDISERKAVEQELAQYRLELEKRVEQRTREVNERSEQLNTIFTLSPDGFVSFDQHRCVAFSNQAFTRMTGLDGLDIIGLTEDKFTEKLAARCLPSASFPGISALRSAWKKMDEASTPNPATPSKRQLFELIEPISRVLEAGIRTSHSESVSQILYLRDVTHETEVDRLKSEFLSTAAHELRTPMASIFGYSEILLSDTFEAPERNEFLTIIHRQSKLMASVINELLDLARIEARRGKDFKLQRVPLQTIVQQTLADFQPPESRKPPEIQSCDDTLEVKIDSGKMQQVVLNIISNAYKYSAAGSPILVRIYQEQTDSQTRACFEVQDQGIGMNAEQLARVCERFYRADTSGKVLGTGLGMSIVKEIVDLLKGELTLQSELGKGSIVKVSLPLA